MVLLHQTKLFMKRYLFYLFFLSAISLSFGQENGNVWGHISDAELDDEPLIFAEVELKGSSRSVQTNFHGNFELNDLKPGNYELIIRYLGYESVEIPIVVAENRVTRIDYSMGQLNNIAQAADVANEDSTAYPTSPGEK